jgi:membrane associated rhomboid family serine protease
MAFEIWARAQAKWRGVFVYAALHAAMQFVTTLISSGTSSPGLGLFASLAGAATGIYCLVMLWQLLFADREGDDSWPPIWS